jgi:hypothetical protein
LWDGKFQSHAAKYGAQTKFQQRLTSAARSGCQGC